MNSTNDMDTKFEIPEDICEQAKQYMANLLLCLEKKGIEVEARDFFGLNMIAETFNDWIEALATIKKEGKVIRETNARNTTLKKPHPAVKMKNDSALLLRKLLNDFGLTLTTKHRIDAVQGNLFDENPQYERFRVVK
ncbi:hypothetical protein ES707_16036 [subsurface metagenome]